MKRKTGKNGKTPATKRASISKPQKDPVTTALVHDGKWAIEHLGEFVKEHPRKILAIVNRQIAGVADRADEAIAQARQKFPDALPFLCLVPSEEDLVCVL